MTIGDIKAGGNGLRIAIASDLHLEFSPIDIFNEENADVLILAGDILLGDYLIDFPSDYDNTQIVSSRQMKAWRFRQFLQDCSEQFKDVIYVAGNHEYYHGKVNKVLAGLQEECNNLGNVHFLENRSITIGNVLFVGGTLWTDCHGRDPLTLYELKHGMADFNVITYDNVTYRKLLPEDTITFHKRTLEYIGVMVDNAPKDHKVVVVGHHAPSFNSVDEMFKDAHLMNGGYATDLSGFIMDRPNIALWIHGHMHNKSDYMIGNTRIFCNPRGYKGYEKVANDFKLAYIDL